MTDRGTTTTALPPVVDRAAWAQELADLRVREKAHTHEGDAIAAARRRLPITEVDAAATLTGAAGEVTLLDVFEGRRQLIVYKHMWHDDEPFAAQCPGCTFYAGQVPDLAVLHSHDVTFAVVTAGPHDDTRRYRDFLGWTMPWYSIRDRTAQWHTDPGEFLLACFVREGGRVFETYRTTGRGVEVIGPTYGLLDRTVWGRQERWEDSPEGWPQPWRVDGDELRSGGRPAFQQTRLTGGHHDPTVGATGEPEARRGVS